MTLLEQPPQSADWNRWRGGVDQTLKQVDSRLGTMEIEVKETNKTLSGMPEALAKVIANGQTDVPASPPVNGQPITFKWFTEKLLLPIVMLVASLIIAAAVSGVLGG